jgi:hypothetical protein
MCIRCAISRARLSASSLDSSLRSSLVWLVMRTELGGARRMSRKSKKRQLVPVGALFGAREFEDSYPEETMRLGVLTALWSLVERDLCDVLAEFLNDRERAEAAFYSTTNHKARRDMVKAVGAVSKLDPSLTVLLGMALDATKDAADARNNLLHSLFQMDVDTGRLVTVSRKPATKTPEILRYGVLNDINAAIGQCRRANDLLNSVVLNINPEIRAFLQRDRPLAS